MTRLTDEQLKELLVLNHTRSPYLQQVTALVSELLLLRAECRAARVHRQARISHERSKSLGDADECYSAQEAYSAARKATDAAGFAP